MPITEARKKANHKWDEANRDRSWKCTVRFPTEDEKYLVAAVAKDGTPVAEFVQQHVYTAIEFERAFGDLWDDQGTRFS